MLSFHAVLIVLSRFLFNQGQPVPPPSYFVVIPQTRIAPYMLCNSDTHRVYIYSLYVNQTRYKRHGYSHACLCALRPQLYPLTVDPDKRASLSDLA